MGKRIKINYDEKANYILDNLIVLHKKYYSLRTFDGPSLYFHQKALKKSDKQYEYIYAALTSWGMHRMGKRGAKMTDFKTFIDSLKTIRNNVKLSRIKKLDSLSESDFTKLEIIFRSIKIMKTNTNIVGNSKVIAHLFPKAVPPIDREYTLYYLRGSKSIVNNLDKEWELYKNIIIHFYQIISKNRNFKSSANRWLKKKKKYPWDTSIPKIIDNLVIAAIEK